MKHVIVELICLYSCIDDKEKKLPSFCKYGADKEGAHCIEGDGKICPFLGYTMAPLELALSDAYGEIADEDYFIGFGSDMESKDIKERESQILSWESICKNKIQEAYEECMKINIKNKK